MQLFSEVFLEKMNQKNNPKFTEKLSENIMNNIKKFLEVNDKSLPFRDSLFRIQINKLNNLNQRFHNGKTLMHYTAKFGSVEMLNLLIEKQLPLNIKDYNHFTPLHDAILSKNIDSIRYLLENYSNIHAQSSLITGKKSPLHLAVEKDHLETVLLLLSFNANIDQKMFNQCTALHIGSANNNSNCCLILLDKGANAEAQDFHGRTPLHFASHKNSTKNIEILLRFIKNPNRSDYLGNTALHLAAAQGNLEAVRILIEKGRSNYKIKNTYGYSCKHFAERLNFKGKNKKVIEYLSNY